jgi:hypothetical protein
MRVFAAFVIVLLAGIGPAAAQSAGPYVTGHAGATGGDGGGALITGAAAGYMSPHRLGFELEISVSPDVDFPQPPFSILSSIFPAPKIDIEGRMLWLQTNVVATVVEAGKLRAAVVGGGGVVNVERTIAYGYPYPTPLLSSTLVPIPLPFPYDMRVTTTETAMSLNAGGIVDYALTKHLRVGVDARYMHAFLNESMKAARVTARGQWGF